MPEASIFVFSDFTCPFSYVTEAALRPLAAAAGIRVEYRAFELYPAPAPLPVPGAGGEWPTALRELAASAGVALGEPELVPRTRKAHETARFARAHGLENEVRDAIFRAYWRDARDIGRVDVLAALAVQAGLAADDVKIALDIDAHADEVVRDRHAADRLGIRHTPSMIVDAGGEARLLVGAQGADDLRALFRDLGGAGLGNASADDR
jgi:predicted DsbA family dithiol-disulfide isomerase